MADTFHTEKRSRNRMISERSAMNWPARFCLPSLLPAHECHEIRSEVSTLEANQAVISREHTNTMSIRIRAPKKSTAKSTALKLFEGAFQPP